VRKDDVADASDEVTNDDGVEGCHDFDFFIASGILPFEPFDPVE
jgi:hypothetical protein